MTDITTQVCRGTTRAGTACRLKAGPTGYCQVHQPVVAEVPATEARSEELAVLDELSDLGEEFTIEVSRMPGNVFEDRIQSSDLSLDHLKSTFGGGRYTLRPKKNGRFFPGGKTVEVRIAGAAKAQGEEKANGAVAPISAPTDMGGILSAIATMFAPIMAAAVRPPPPPPPPPPQATIPEMMQMALTFAEFARDSRPEPSPYGEVLENVAKPLLGIITGPQGPGPATSPTAAASPQGATPAASPNPAPPAEAPRTAEGMAHAISNWLEPHRKKNQNPALWAEVFLEEVGGDVGGDADLLAFGAQAALDPAALDYWAAAVPVVGENREWYGDFLKELRTLLDEIESAPEEADPGGGPGHVDDAVAHEGAGEGGPG